jgi:integrase
MLSQLWTVGRADVIESIRDRKVHPLQVLAKMREGGLQDLPNGNSMVSLKETVFPWIERYDRSEKHRQNLRAAFTSLLDRCGDVSVGSLPSALARYREQMRRHPTMFNRTRAAVQAFLRDTQGRHSRLWMEASSVGSLRVKRGATHPVSPKELHAITTNVPEGYAAMLWSMALTGMGPTEYWGDWKVSEDRVQINGTKRSARRRQVPLVGRISGPTTTYKPVLKTLQSVRPEMVLYDLRRSYAMWMENAGIPRTRRRLYLGHGVRDVTDLYEQHEIARYLAEDAEKLRALPGLVPGQAKRNSRSSGRKLKR